MAEARIKPDTLDLIWAVRSSGLSSAARFVLIVLAYRRHRKGPTSGWAPVSIGTLAEDTAYSRATVARVLVELEAAGAIVVEHARGRGRVNKFAVSAAWSEKHLTVRRFERENISPETVKGLTGEAKTSHTGRKRSHSETQEVVVEGTTEKGGEKDAASPPLEASPEEATLVLLDAVVEAYVAGVKERTGAAGFVDAAGRRAARELLAGRESAEDAVAIAHRFGSSPTQRELDGDLTGLVHVGMAVPRILAELGTGRPSGLLYPPGSLEAHIERLKAQRGEAP